VEPLIDQLEGCGRALDNPWARAAAARCRGLLLASRGDTEGAIGELERALVEQERSPQPLERGRTLLELGAAQRRGKRKRDARTSLQEALDAFEGIGAALWAERARKELGLPEARGPLPHRARVEARALTKQTSGVPGFLGGPGKSGVIEVGRREAQP